MIGAADWQAEEWLTSFYPEDLPSEWRLSYYANEFSTTFLDCLQWCDPEQQDLSEEMLEDCHTGFHPVVSIGIDKVTPQQVNSFFQWLAQLDEEIGIQRVAGVMLSADGGAVEKSSLQLWRECIPQELPIALQGYSGFDDINRQWLLDYRMSPIWLANQVVDADFGYWLGDISVTSDTRAMAAQVEAYLSVVSVNHSICLIAGSGYEDIERLRQLSTVVRLING